MNNHQEVTQYLQFTSKHQKTLVNQTINNIFLGSRWQKRFVLKIQKW